MTATLYDDAGSTPIVIGSAKIPVGGDLGEGILSLQIKSASGLPVLGADKQYGQLEIKLRCGRADEHSDLIPAGDHCGMGKTGTPDIYDADCRSGYCAWVSLFP